MTKNIEQPEGSQMNLNEAFLDQGIETRYGTRENPVTIEQARKTIRTDYLKFCKLVTDFDFAARGQHFIPNRRRFGDGFGLGVAG